MADSVFDGAVDTGALDKATLKRELFEYLFSMLDRATFELYTLCEYESDISHIEDACEALRTGLSEFAGLRARIAVILGHQAGGQDSAGSHNASSNASARSSKQGIAWEVRRVSHFGPIRSHQASAAQTAIKAMLERMAAQREIIGAGMDSSAGETSDAPADASDASAASGALGTPPRSRSPSPERAAVFARGSGLALSPIGPVGRTPSKTAHADSVSPVLGHHPSSTPGRAGARAGVAAGSGGGVTGTPPRASAATTGSSAAASASRTHPSSALLAGAPTSETSQQATAVMLLNEFERLHSGAKWGDLMMDEDWRDAATVARDNTHDSGDKARERQGDRERELTVQGADSGRSGSVGFAQGGREVEGRPSPAFDWRNHSVSQRASRPLPLASEAAASDDSALVSLTRRPAGGLSGMGSGGAGPGGGCGGNSKVLASPARQKSTPDAVAAKAVERHAKAEVNRGRMAEEKRSRLAEATVRQAEVSARQAAAHAEMSEQLVQRLNAAEERYEEVLRTKSAKAGNEVQKAQEVRFIGRLGRLDTESRRQALQAIQEQAARRRAETLAKRADPHRAQVEALTSKAGGEDNTTPAPIVSTAGAVLVADAASMLARQRSVGFSYAAAAGGGQREARSRAQSTVESVGEDARTLISAARPAPAITGPSTGPAQGQAHDDVGHGLPVASVEARQQESTRVTAPVPVPVPARMRVGLPPSTAPWAKAKMVTPPAHVTIEAAAPPNAVTVAATNPSLPTPTAAAPALVVAGPQGPPPDEPWASKGINRAAKATDVTAGGNKQASHPAVPDAAAPSSGLGTVTVSGAPPPQPAGRCSSGQNKARADRRKEAKGRVRVDSKAHTHPSSEETQGWTLVGTNSTPKDMSPVRLLGVAPTPAPRTAADARVGSPLRNVENGTPHAPSDKVGEGRDSSAPSPSAAEIVSGSGSSQPPPLPEKGASAPPPQPPASSKKKAREKDNRAVEDREKENRAVDDDDAVLELALRERTAEEKGGVGLGAPGGAGMPVAAAVSAKVSAARKKKLRARKIALLSTATAFHAACTECLSDKSVPVQAAAGAGPGEAVLKACSALRRDVPVEDEAPSTSAAAQAPEEGEILPSPHPYCTMPVDAGVEDALRDMWRVTEGRVVAAAQAKIASNMAAMLGGNKAGAGEAELAPHMHHVPDPLVSQIVHIDAVMTATGHSDATEAGKAALRRLVSSSYPDVGMSHVSPTDMEAVRSSGALSAVYRCAGKDAVVHNPRAASLASRIIALACFTVSGREHALTRAGVIPLVDTLVASSTELVACWTRKLGASAGAKAVFGGAAVTSFPPESVPAGTDMAEAALASSLMNTCLALAALFRHAHTPAMSLHALAGVQGAAIAYALAAGVPAQVAALMQALVKLPHDVQPAYAQLASVCIAPILAMLQRPMVDSAEKGHLHVHRVLGVPLTTSPVPGCPYVESLLSSVLECDLLQVHACTLSMLVPFMQMKTGHTIPAKALSPVLSAMTMAAQLANAVARLDVRVLQKAIAELHTPTPTLTSFGHQLLLFLDISLNTGISVISGLGQQPHMVVPAEALIAECVLCFGYAGLDCPAFQAAVIAPTSSHRALPAAIVSGGDGRQCPLRTLLNMPIRYTSLADKPILLPTLLVLTAGSLANRGILTTVMTPSSIVSMLKLEGDAAEEQKRVHHVLQLGARYPQARWQAAVAFLEGSLADID